MPWGAVAGAVIAGIGSSMNQKSANKANMDQSREGGIQARKTAAFEDDRAYFREQQRRAESKRSLDMNYKQFSTLKDIAPNYVEKAGLDAVGTKPQPGSY